MSSVPGLAAEAKREQTAVRTSALRDLLEAWSMLDPENLRGSAVPWLGAVVPLILRYRDVSVQRADESYNQMRALQVPAAGEFRLPIPPDPDLAVLQTTLLVTGPQRVAKLLRLGALPPKAHADAFPMMSGVATKSVLDAGRAAVIDAVGQDREAIAYARLPVRGACGFCMMLASRGAVYSSRTVTKTTGRAKKQGSGKDFHDHCLCTPFAVYSHDTDMPPIIDEAEALWIDSTQGLSGKAALSAYRVAVGETKGPN